jgi:hypothetical protein
VHERLQCSAVQCSAVQCTAGAPRGPTAGHTKNCRELLPTQLHCTALHCTNLPTTLFTVLGPPWSVQFSRSCMWSGCSVHGTRYSVIGTRYSVLCTRYSVLCTLCSVLGTPAVGAARKVVLRSTAAAVAAAGSRPILLLPPRGSLSGAATGPAQSGRSPKRPWTRENSTKRKKCCLFVLALISFGLAQFTPNCVPYFQKPAMVDLGFN